MQLDPDVLAQLLHTCVGGGTWDLALQLCNSSLVAQARVPLAAKAKRGVCQSFLAVGVMSKTVHPLPCPAPVPHLQGPAAAPLFNYVLQSAASVGNFKDVVAVLTAMRASGLEVDPAVAALVRLPQGAHSTGASTGNSAVVQSCIAGPT